MILDAEGRPAGDDDWSWAAHALWNWLNDERCRLTIIGRGVLVPDEIPPEMLRRVSRAAAQEVPDGRARLLIGKFEVSRIGGLLHAGLTGGKPFDQKSLRSTMLRLLRDRVVRVACARVVLQNEHQMRDEYEATVDAYPEVLDAWSKAVTEKGALAGPRPELPDAVPPPRDRHAVLKELQEIWTELEKRVESESLIVRPFGA